MSRGDENTALPDDRGTIDKVFSGDVRSLDGEDVANMGQGGVMAAMMKAGRFVPGLEVANQAFVGYSANKSAEKERATIAHYFGDLKALQRDPAFKKKCKQLDDRWSDSMFGSSVGMAGSMACGALVGTLTPIPFGFVIGAVGGGLLSSTVYNKTCVKQSQDPVAINLQICKMMEAGEAVPPALVFAALASNVSGKQGEKIDKLLKKYTGTSLFSEALGDPKNIEKIEAMMYDPKIRNIIRAQVQMPLNPQDPDMPVAEQYAQLLSSGALDPRDLLKAGAGLDAQIRADKAAMNPAWAPAPEMPDLPMVQGRGRTERSV